MPNANYYVGVEYPQIATTQFGVHVVESRTVNGFEVRTENDSGTPRNAYFVFTVIKGGAVIITGGVDGVTGDKVF